jgi:hypothetical protein
MMASHKTFLHSSKRDSFGRVQPVPLDFSRLPYCECAEAYLAEIKEQFGSVLDSPTVEGLEEAILLLSLSYAERLKQLPNHRFNSCVPEVFTEVLEILTDKRDALLRDPKRSRQAHLRVGLEA